MTREEADNYHNKFYGKEILELNIQDLENLLRGEYLCTSVNYEYSFECSLNIDKSTRDSLLTSLLILKEFNLSKSEIKERHRKTSSSEIDVFFKGKKIG